MNIIKTILITSSFLMLSALAYAGQCIITAATGFASYTSRCENASSAQECMQIANKPSKYQIAQGTYVQFKEGSCPQEVEAPTNIFKRTRLF